MGRRNVIDGLAEQLRQVNGFDTNSKGTVSVHDLKVLNMGVDRAAIVMTNRSEQEQLAMGNILQMHWYLDVVVAIRHNNDVVQAREDADTYVQNIVDRIRQNDTLGGSCFTSMITAIELADERLLTRNIPYLVEVLTVKATEDQSG